MFHGVVQFADSAVAGSVAAYEQKKYDLALEEWQALEAAMDIAAANALEDKQDGILEKYAQLAKECGFGEEEAASVGWKVRDRHGNITLPNQHPEKRHFGNAACDLRGLATDTYIAEQSTSLRGATDAFIEGMKKVIDDEAAGKLILASMPLLKKFPKVVEKLAKKRSYDHIFAHARGAAWTSINFSENTRRRRRGATPNHRRARRCASPKNIILDFLAPNSSFGDYNNMGGKVLVYKKSVMEVALEWVRAAVRRADECVKAL